MRTGLLPSLRLVVIVAPLVIGGCSTTADRQVPAPTPAATASSPGVSGLPAGWVVRSDPAQGFSLAIPDAWDFVVRDSRTFSANLDAVTQHSPELAGYFRQSLEADAQVRLIAADSRSLATGFAANLHVMVSDLGPVASAPRLGDLVGAKVKLLAKQAGPVKRSSDQLSGVTAIRLDYSLGTPPANPGPSASPLPVATPAAPASPGASPAPLPAVRSYLAVVQVGGRALEYELTMGALPDAAETTFQELGRNFKLFPPVQPTTTRPTPVPGGGASPPSGAGNSLSQ